MLTFNKINTQPSSSHPQLFAKKQNHFFLQNFYYVTFNNNINFNQTIKYNCTL